MSIDGIRFRAEGALLVLQVAERDDRYSDYASYGRNTPTWRDATTQDMLHVARHIQQDGLADRLKSLEASVQNLQAHLAPVPAEEFIESDFNRRHGRLG